MASSSGAKADEACMDVTHGDEGANSREAMKVTDVIRGKRGTRGRTVCDISGSEEGNVVNNDDEEYVRWLMARDDGVFPLNIMPKTGHRDGSIYKLNTTHQWKKQYRITDRDERYI
ncbi:uncharacterized protein LOC119320128 [Triticum dicoccoides]|uniref:uncharacterized protein LOC119320128 n=1 Tax=Triticum dicoccoides TaxID=85692 RepID=UPI001891954F|nr:uncharacterized protein LOC119320128 [Triticum dicoccoides]